MTKLNWTKPGSGWKKGGLAAALASVAIVGTLAVGSGVYAQTTNPPTTDSAPSTQQGAQQGVRPQRGGPHGGHGGPGLAVAAKALGIDEAALKTELQAGKTIADVAKAKNIDLSVVSNALLAEEKTKLAKEVTDGKLTQAQADARLANAPARIADLLNGKLPQGGLGEHGSKGGPGLAVAAKALGIDEAALKTELQAGKTIADVAKAKNIDLSVVSSALLADEKAKLAQAVTDGKLTQAQADARLANAPTRITDMLNCKLPAGGPGKHGAKTNGAAKPTTSPLATPLPGA